MCRILVKMTSALSWLTVGMEVDKIVYASVSKREIIITKMEYIECTRTHAQAHAHTHLHTHIICSVNSKKSLNCEKTFLHLFSTSTLQSCIRHAFFFQWEDHRRREMGAQLWFFAHCYLY